MMQQIIIREATADDLETLLLFEQGVIGAERPFDSTIKEGNIHYYDIPFMLAAPHIHVVVAELDGVPVGCGYARIEAARHYLKHTKHAYLGFMFVQPAHRGKGFNKKIIHALVQWAAGQRINEIQLDVYEGNTPAIKAYEKAGFVRHLVNMRMGLGEG